MRQSPALAGPGFPDWEAVDAAIGDGAEAAFEFLERLVASPSTVGRELPAQQIVAAELDRLGFEVSGLGFLSVMEEECTGNGTLAACRAGVLADAAVLLEPTDLGLLLGGTGILWAEIEIAGVAGHAESADRAVNPVRFVPAILRALAGLEDELNKPGDDPVFDRLPRPYNVNVGTVTAGDWPSSVPARARLGVRVGVPRRWTPDEAFDRVRSAVLGAAAADPWLASHPPSVRPAGFRAEGYLIDDGHPLVTALAAAHACAHGGAPRRIVLGSTT